MSEFPEFEKYTVPEKSYDTYTSNSTDIIVPYLQPLANTCFVKLDILSQSVTKKLMDEYQSRIKDYEQELDEWEEREEENQRLGFDKNPDNKRPKEPEKPFEKPDYRETYFNLSDKVISAWTTGHDDDGDCDIIVMDYYLKSQSPFVEGQDQLVIRMTKNEWVNLLNSLGANGI